LHRMREAATEQQRAGQRHPQQVTHARDPIFAIISAP
jgi:hypothetical protein